MAAAVSLPYQADLDAVGERIVRVPDRYRDFTEPHARALGFYRVPAPALEYLLELGLPHSRDADGYVYDRNDLRSVSMALPVRSPQRTTLQSMAGALLSGAAQQRIRRSVDIQAHCPDPGHEGLCEFHLADEAARGPDTLAVRQVDSTHFEVEVELAGGRADHLTLTAAEELLISELSAVSFHRIPFVLNVDLGFLAETRLADCRLATRFMAARGAELGVVAYEATGLFLARPFSPRHYWPRLRRGAQWLDADPFFLTALTRWGLLDQRDWPPNRRPVGAFWQVDIYPDAALVTHKGGSPVSIMTR